MFSTLFMFDFCSYKPVQGDWVQASVSAGSVANDIKPVRTKQLTGTVSNAPYRDRASGM